MGNQSPFNPQVKMSAVKAAKRISTPQIRARKGKEPIVCLTAYTTEMARRLDLHVDLLLVGDSTAPCPSPWT